MENLVKSFSCISNSLAPKNESPCRRPAGPLLRCPVSKTADVPLVIGVERICFITRQSDQTPSSSPPSGDAIQGDRKR